MKSSMVVSANDSPATSPEAGLRRQVLAFSPSMMLVRHVMRKGWVGARHSHPHEQLVYVIRGKLRFVCGEETFEAATGTSFIVPGGIEHQAVALEDSEVIDVFAPYREDYVAGAHEQ